MWTWSIYLYVIFYFRKKHKEIHLKVILYLNYIDTTQEGHLISSVGGQD